MSNAEDVRLLYAQEVSNLGMENHHLETQYEELESKYNELSHQNVTQTREIETLNGLLKQADERKTAAEIIDAANKEVFLSMQHELENVTTENQELQKQLELVAEQLKRLEQVAEQFEQRQTEERAPNNTDANTDTALEAENIELKAQVARQRTDAQKQEEDLEEQKRQQIHDQNLLEAQIKAKQLLLKTHRLLNKALDDAKKLVTRCKAVLKVLASYLSSEKDVPSVLEKRAGIAILSDIPTNEKERLPWLFFKMHERPITSKNYKILSELFFFLLNKAAETPVTSAAKKDKELGQNVIDNQPTGEEKNIFSIVEHFERVGSLGGDGETKETDADEKKRIKHGRLIVKECGWGKGCLGLSLLAYTHKLSDFLGRVGYPNRTNISRRFKNCFLNPNTAAIDTY